MPSKGIDCYSYICLDGAEIEFAVPGTTRIKTDQKQWQLDRIEVDKSHLTGAFTFTGQFSFKVSRNGAEIINQHVDVNTMTGNLDKGTLKNMFDQQSFVGNDVIVTFLFYDAGSGRAGLPDRHQCYVVVGPNRGNWMGEIAPLGSDTANKPFRRFVLPAAHDIGMNSMMIPDLLVQNASKPFVNILKLSSNAFSNIADNATSAIVAAIAPNIISGLAVTQKDKLETVLEIGARYFEFRPARLHEQVRKYNVLPDDWYFTHGPIPGMIYPEFLHGILQFLMGHQTEIVVVHLRWDGVPDQCVRPSDDDLNNMLKDALNLANGSINVGNQDDLQQQSIDALRQQGKRLILLKDCDSLSTYTDEANATLNGDSIIAQYDRMHADMQNGKPFTNIQCQATSSNIKDVVIYSALSANVSNSPLLGTKSICDFKTLPWIRNNALQRFTQDQLILIMNDFIDGATIDVAIDLSATRLRQ